jgi:hypothetical protein
MGIHAECFHRQQAREADRIAIFLCNMRTAMWSKRKPKPKDFLGRPLVSEQRKKRRRKRTTTED